MSIELKINIFFMILAAIICMGAVIDHGSLWGLYDDDHPQYLRKDATRPLDDDWNAGEHTITAAALTAGDLTAYAVDVNDLTAYAVDVNDLTAYAVDANTLTLTEWAAIGTLALAGGSITDADGTIDFNTTDLQGIGSLSFGDFTSLVPTGTAPFYCASTTRCVNLNADLLDGIDSMVFARLNDNVEFLIVDAGVYKRGGDIGITQVLTFAAAAPGDCNSITVSGGIITGYTVAE